MKRWMSLGLVALLLCLPMAACAQSWSDFVKEAEAAMKGQKGEVVLTPSEAVEAFGAKDKALKVPNNVQLVLDGGTFARMLLGGGELILQGCQLEEPAGNAPAIWAEGNVSLTLKGYQAEMAGNAPVILAEGSAALALEDCRMELAGDAPVILFDGNGSKDLNLSLHIDADSILSAAGSATIAYQQTGKHKVQLTVDNQGTIRNSMDFGSGIFVGLNDQNGKESSILIQNSGTIEGAVGVWADPRSNGQNVANGKVMLEIVNEGTISATQWGIFAALTTTNSKAELHITNTAGGVVTAGEDDRSGSGVILSMGDGYYHKKPLSGQGFIHNDGTITGGASGIGVSTGYSNPLPVLLTGSGVVNGDSYFESTNRGPYSISFDTFISTDEPIEQDAFNEVALAWLETSGIDALPQGTPVLLCLYTYEGSLYPAETQTGQPYALTEK